MEPWRQILNRLESQVSRQSFQNWLAPLHFERLDEKQTLHLSAPTEHTKTWVLNEYQSTILDVAQSLAYPVQQIHIDVDTKQSPAVSPKPSAAVAPQQSAFEFSAPRQPFNPRYTFDNFVVGSCNEFAHAAAQAVAAKPALTYNPLYIYGGVGMGKTHLMQAIAQHYLNVRPDYRVVYVSGEEFINQMINSLRYDRMSSFHERFRSADALLVDDIQIIGAKERTQEEFFHTFNALHNMQKQIVISSDSHPKRIPGLVARLRSRFEWGLLADIQPPDLETKMAILDRKCESHSIRLPEDVRTYLATTMTSNIRELEGALVRLIALSSVTGVPISLSMAQQNLAPAAQETSRRVSIPSIQTAVAKEFGLETDRLCAKTNARSISYPRQIAMYLSKELTNASLPEIGRAFNGKHHTTVLHAVNKIERLRLADPEVNMLIHNLSTRFH